MNENKKDLNSLLSLVFLIIILLCAVVIIGVYTNNRWRRMRDIRRRSDIAQVKKALEYSKFEFNELPDNQSKDDWDLSYDSILNKSQALFKDLQSKGVVSNMFDPKNNEQYYYRYHKFENGEYGCWGTYAIFQIMNFEGEIQDRGEGSCPERDFKSEAPNGYTLQVWKD